MHIFDVQVPFHKVVAHRRCVSAKRLHIFDVLPLWVAHQKCAAASRKHIFNVFPQSGRDSVERDIFDMQVQMQLPNVGHFKWSIIFNSFPPYSMFWVVY
jgi:hypothetical protein